MTRGRRRIWSALATLGLAGCFASSAKRGDVIVTPGPAASQPVTVTADQLAGTLAAKVGVTMDAKVIAPITAQIKAEANAFSGNATNFGIGATIAVVVTVIVSVGGAFWLMRSMLKAAICKFTECRKD